jgi:hypothetical protein
LDGTEDGINDGALDSDGINEGKVNGSLRTRIVQLVE